jgi:AraC family transcriptional regulator
LKGSYALLSSSYQYIFGQWMPKSGVELRDDPGFEKYLNFPESTNPDDLETEIWVPVK